MCLFSNKIFFFSHFIDIQLQLFDLKAFFHNFILKVDKGYIIFDLC